jgi:dienelactone hydrolase
MRNEEGPEPEKEKGHGVSGERRAFVKRSLALGAGLMGTGCLAGASAESSSEAAGPSTATAPPDTRSRQRLASPLREEPFSVQVEGRTVPGILWHPPETTADTPLVLAGHGGGFGTAGHKRAEKIVALAAELGEYGIATAAIDQPGCGDRPGAEREQARRRTLTIEQAIESLWTPALVEEMARDWQGSLDFLRAEWGLGTAGIGYWGLSGGTTFGLPLVALEPRISAAVLGLNSAVPLMLAYASRITCPVLYTMNLDDDFMSRDEGLALFDALPTQDKFVLAYPGNHGQNLEPATREWARFFASRLRSPDTPSVHCRGPHHS